MQTEQTQQSPQQAPVQNPNTPIKSEDSCTCFQSMFTYMQLIFAIMVVCVKRNKQNAYLRFNAFQAIYTSIAMLVVYVVVGIIVGGLMMIMALVMQGGIMWVVLAGIVGFAGYVIVIVLAVMLIIAMIKAYSGTAFKIPVIGNMAEKSATKYVR